MQPKRETLGKLVVVGVISWRSCCNGRQREGCVLSDALTAEWDVEWRAGTVMSMDRCQTSVVFQCGRELANVKQFCGAKVFVVLKQMMQRMHDQRRSTLTVCCSSGWAFQLRHNDLRIFQGSLGDNIIR